MKNEKLGMPRLREGISRLFTVFCAMACVALAFADVQVSSVAVRQRYPWNGKVDVEFVLASTKSNVVVSLSAVNQEDGSKLPMNTVETIDGTALSLPLLGHPGKNRFVWNAGEDLPKGFKSQSLAVKVLASTGLKPEEKLYCVIDVSGGPQAESYPVLYLNAVPIGGWTDEYKTTKIVLRKIEAGTFQMGESRDNPISGIYCDTVTLTKHFYIGVFEVTQKQWELVMGDNPSTYKGDLRPVEGVSFCMIRGSDKGNDFPLHEKYLYAKDRGSFLWILGSKAGVDADLPTSAQWEYACRAGTTTMFNDDVVYSFPEIADAPNHLIDHLGRCKDNRYDGRGGFEEHTCVGLYKPNNWGLYDMHGNVMEWCLDWDHKTDNNLILVDPLGPAEGTRRRVKGGAWITVPYYCRSGDCSYNLPPEDTGKAEESVLWGVRYHDFLGFRLVINQ